MSEIRDLMRTIRAGQRPAGKISPQALQKAKAEGLSPSEMKTLSEMLSNPELRDQFSPELRSSLEGFVRGSGDTLKPVGTLVPDLGRVADSKDVSQRFSADFTLLRDQLMNRNVPEDKQAERAFEFFTKYAERFVALVAREEAQKEETSQKVFKDTEEKPELPKDETAHTAAPQVRPERVVKEAPAAEHAVEEHASEERPAESDASHAFAKNTANEGRRVSREDQTRQAHSFAAAADALGFGELHDAHTGKSGTELVYELTQTQSLRELQQRLSDVQVRSNAHPKGGELPKPPELPQAAPLVPAKTPALESAERVVGTERRIELDIQNRPEALKVQPWAAEAGKVVVQPLDRSQRQDDMGQDQDSPAGFTDKKLGRNMMWNLLHRFRGREQEESALTKDVWDKIAVGALLFLFGLALMVVVLVSL